MWSYIEADHKHSFERGSSNLEWRRLGKLPREIRKLTNLLKLDELQRPEGENAVDSKDETAF